MTFANLGTGVVMPPAPKRPKFVPVADVAAALGVTEARVVEVLPGTGARLAQMPDGSQRHEVSAEGVQKIAASLGRPLPAGYPEP
jgi:hypothetical protein